MAAALPHAGQNRNRARGLGAQGQGAPRAQRQEHQGGLRAHGPRADDAHRRRGAEARGDRARGGGGLPAALAAREEEAPTRSSSCRPRPRAADGNDGATAELRTIAAAVPGAATAQQMGAVEAQLQQIAAAVGGSGGGAADASAATDAAAAAAATSAAALQEVRAALASCSSTQKTSAASSAPSARCWRGRGGRKRRSPVQGQGELKQAVGDMHADEEGSRTTLRPWRRLRAAGAGHAAAPPPPDSRRHDRRGGANLAKIGQALRHRAQGFVPGPTSR